jgi:tetratricopeptide (TPR) repeat protein
LVSGSYYLDGEELELQARLTDYETGELLYAFKPISAMPSHAAGALDNLREPIVAAVAFHWTPEFDVSLMNPPSSYDVLLAFERGWRTLGSDYEASIAAFKKALELDPEFLYPRILIILSYLNLGDREQMSRELSAAKDRWHDFTPFEQKGLDWATARLKRMHQEALSHQREMVRIAPHLGRVHFNLAAGAFRLNRPKETVEVLGAILPIWKERTRPTAWWALRLVMQSHHSLGEYEQALEWANVGLEIFPDVGDFFRHKGGTLAAMGRLDDLNKVIDECTRVQLRDSAMNAGTVMVYVALELRAHGHGRESDALALRAAEWYEHQMTGMDITDRDTRSLRGHSRALRVADRWREARAPLMELRDRGWDPIYVAGALGVIAARTGDHDEAWQIFNEFPNPGPPFDPASRFYWRACIASFLGEKVVAVELLKEGYANGLPHTLEFHVDVDLEPLWDYPPFQELIAPKG